MKVTVDTLLCEANGLCVRTAPEVFSLDDEDVLHIAADGVVLPDLAVKVRDAVSRCPKMALSLDEE
jgi:ferredoxin